MSRLRILQILFPAIPDTLVRHHEYGNLDPLNQCSRDLGSLGRLMLKLLFPATHELLKKVAETQDGARLIPLKRQVAQELGSRHWTALMRQVNPLARTGKT